MTRDHLLSALFIAALIALVTLVDWTSPPNESAELITPRVVYDGDELEVSYRDPGWPHSAVRFRFTSGSGEPAQEHVRAVVDGVASTRLRAPDGWIQVQVNAGRAPQRTVGVLTRDGAGSSRLDEEVPMHLERDR